MTERVYPHGKGMVVAYGESRSDACEAFLRAVLSLERTWGLSISHQDSHGAFQIEPYSESLAEWLSEAAEIRDE